MIESLIMQNLLSTQDQLVATLKRHGVDVTQATVSRDMRELGVRKGTGRDGRTRYFIPPPQVRRDPQEVLSRVLRDSGGEARQAQNLVVVLSEPGTAPTVGRALDEMGHEDVIGTVAGDDTVLMVLSDSGKAAKMERFINDLARERA